MNGENNQPNEHVSISFKVVNLSEQGIAALFKLNEGDPLIQKIKRICKRQVKRKVDAEEAAIKALVAIFMFLSNGGLFTGMSETFRAKKRVDDNTRKEVIDLYHVAALAEGIGMEKVGTKSAAALLVAIFSKLGCINLGNYHYMTKAEVGKVLHDPAKYITILPPSVVNTTSWTELQNNPTELIKMTLLRCPTSELPNTVYYSDKTLKFTVTTTTKKEDTDSDDDEDFSYDEQEFASLDKVALLVGDSKSKRDQLSALKWKAVAGGVGVVSSETYTHTHRPNECYFVECFLGKGTGGRSSSLGKRYRKRSSKTKKSKTADSTDPMQALETMASSES